MITDRDIPGWFPEVNRNHLIKLIHDYSVKTVLEIGSFLGKSTVFFAQRVEWVCCIDPFCVTDKTLKEEINELERVGAPADWYAIFLDNIFFAKPRARVWTWRSMSSQSEAYVNAWRPKDWPREFDLVYIDGDHSYECVRADIRTYGPPHARIICGDDYECSEGVTKAVLEAFPSACKAGPFWWVVR